MPAGTWNLPDIRKTVPFRGIANRSSITIFDTSPTSDNYFNIVDFPERFTAGKNLFKLNAANTTLVDGSDVNIEILDFNGDPIYFEPLNYLEQDGTRVVAVYIYPETSPGLATIYITGRARFNVSSDPLLQNPLPYSESESAGNLYKNYPNLVWTRTINIAPEKFNTSEIIFTQQPRVTVVERVVNYQQPITLNNINISKPGGGGTITIENVPSSGTGVLSAANVNTVYQASRGTPVTSEGQTSTNTPLRSLGGAFNLTRTFTGISKNININTNQGVITSLITPQINTVPTQQTSVGISAVTGYSRLTTTNFALSSSMEGGTILVKNPTISIQLGTALSGSFAIAVDDIQSQGKTIGDFVPDLLGAANANVQLSGSVAFVITDVETPTQAKVSQIAGPGHNAPVLSPFSVTLLKSQNGAANSNGTIRNPEAYDVTEIKSSTEFTSSHTEPLVYATSAQSQSFAEVVLSNIEPATGDIHRIRTSYKPLGQFGDFVSAGETILERLELLEDTGSFEGTLAIGQVYNRMGYFTSLEDYDAYFERKNLTGNINADAVFQPDVLINSINFPTASAYNSDTDQLGTIHGLKQSFAEVKRNSAYAIRFRLKCISGPQPTDNLKYPNSSNNQAEISKARFDIYVSGSGGQGTITPYSLNKESYRLTSYDIDKTLVGVFQDDNVIGKYIGSVEMEPTTLFENSIRDVLFNFTSAIDQNINIFLVQRAGTFALKDLGITADAETGFSPNHARLNIRIPSEFIDVPMSFKFEFFDYVGSKADADVNVFPIKFTGDNTVINGDSNLLSGSIFVGNAIGSGIEIAGVSSGFLRSVGYDGFVSASDGTGPGGFLLYTGSILPDKPDNYTGVGLEFVQDSGSFLRFATADNVSNRPAGLDVRTPRFFFGGDDNFISGSDGKIEISSSNFHLSNAGDVVMQGVITAEAGGTIGGFAITTNAISSSNDSLILRGDSGQVTASSILIDGGRITSGVTIEGSLTANTILTPATINGSPSTILNASSSIDAGGFARFESASIAGFTINTEEIKSSNNNLRLKNTGQITGSNVLFDGGKIGGFTISSTALEGGSGGTRVALTPGTGIHMGNTNFSSAPFSVTNAGVLKATSGEIAGWTIDSQKFTGGNMIIRQDGTIESDGFASNVAGSGFRLTAAQGGFLEVENARIRGTLATTTFEKETVNAVGGQLYVANSTTLTSSAVAPQGIHSASMSTMSVANVTGFAVNEIITAKKISNTGFATEYMLIESASRTDASSETNFAGLLFVRRGYSGSASTTSGSVGDIASTSQTYSGSQVIVSTGKVGTGYIRLNANPNDPTTPYIDIVERTGSAIYDVDLKARLGDLSGIADNSFSDGVQGFGLYTSNGYFKGKIEVAAPDDKIQHRIFVRGGDFTNSTNFPAFVSFGNSFTASQNDSGNSNKPQIGHNLYIVSESINNVLELRFQDNFNTHANRDVSGSMLAAILTGSSYDGTNSLEQDDLIVVVSHDAHRLSQTLYGALTASGATNPREFNSSQALLSIPTSETSRTPYVLVGQRNLGHGNGYEAVGLFDGANTTSGSAIIEAFYTRGRISANLVNQGSQIAGDKLRTGNIESNNFSTSAGSQFNLNDGTFKMGGSSSPALSFDGTDLAVAGNVSASSGEIGGWTIGGGKLGASEIAPNVFRAELDGTNLSLSFNNSTFGSTGIQLQYNGGTPRFFAGTSGNQIKFDGSKLIIASDNFDIDASGNVSMEGTVTATAGAIGGFSIDSTTISSSNDNIILRSTGEITASDILISGGTIAEGIEIGGIPGPGQVIFFDDFTTYASTTDVTSSGGTAGSDTPTFPGDGHVANGTGVGYHAFVNDNPESVIIKSGSSNTFNGNGCVLSIGNNAGEETDEFWAVAMNMIPINSASLYEIEVRLRKPGSSGGTSGNFAGATLFKSDGVTKNNVNGANQYGSQHYFTMFNRAIGTSFETKKGYVKGFDSNGGSEHLSKLDPGTFEAGAEGGFFAPTIVVNYNSIEGTVEIDYIKVTEFAQGGGSTRLTGDSVTTGKLRSVNLSDTLGSEINLNDGTIKFGGLTSPSFAVDTSGNVTASNALFEGEVIAGNLTERYVIVDDTNSGSYLRIATVATSSATPGKNLVFDGSLGGDITSNMEISTSGAFEIIEVELAFTGSQKAQANVFISTPGMTFDEGTINKSIKSLYKSLSGLTLTQRFGS